jgi:hypothetical protein
MSQHSIEELIVESLLYKECTLSEMSGILEEAFPADPDTAYLVLVDFIMNFHYVMMNEDMRLSINENKKSEVLLKYYNTDTDRVLSCLDRKNVSNNARLGLIYERDIWGSTVIFSKCCRFSIANLDIGS